MKDFRSGQHNTLEVECWCGEDVRTFTSSATPRIQARDPKPILVLYAGARFFFFYSYVDYNARPQGPF